MNPNTGPKNSKPPPPQGVSNHVFPNMTRKGRDRIKPAAAAAAGKKVKAVKVLCFVVKPRKCSWIDGKKPEMFVL